MTHAHTAHGHGVDLVDEQQAILARGVQDLIARSQHLSAFKPLPSERYPLPITRAVYGDDAGLEGDAIRRDLEHEAGHDPLHALERVLSLVELFESNQPDAAELFPEDMAFAGQVFGSKRRNGWCALLGGDDDKRQAVQQAIAARWDFTFFPTPTPYRPTGIYVLLERLVRYAFVYGRCRAGDPHEIGHFIEDHTPGVLVCLDPMDDLERTLSLAAMKIGVPAVVPSTYPFPLGRFIQADREQDISEAVVGFANIRRLLPHPGLPSFPEYCLDAKPEAKPEPALTYGDTAESFCMLRKADTPVNGVEVRGQLTPGGGPLGVLIEATAEPLDAVDRDYMERTLVRHLWRLEGHNAWIVDHRLVVGIAEDAAFKPDRLGEVLRVTLRREFPKIKHVRVTIFTDRASIEQGGWHEIAQQERVTREQEMAALNEDTCATFFSCVGCSPFAPDHVCIITPDRVPQCNRPYAMIKTGALYGYDDMSHIHHSKLHRDINSFLVLDKGECLDPARGEWSGVNRRAQDMTQGRTQRIFLHTLDEAPTTGCGCFQMILFKTEAPRPGIGIMHRGWDGRAPDGRRWSDLHYALAGKQAPGISGCAPGYLKSPRFLQADGGWENVVWVTQKVADMAGERLSADAVVSGE